MTTWDKIARWVPARCHRSDTRILSSLMISIQIIISSAYPAMSTIISDNLGQKKCKYRVVDSYD